MPDATAFSQPSPHRVGEVGLGKLRGSMSGDGDGEGTPSTPVRRSPAGALAEEREQTRAQLLAIHNELDRLRERREELERRRRQLLAASLPPRTAGRGSADGSRRGSGDTSAHVMEARGAAAHAHPPPLLMPSSISLLPASYAHGTLSSRYRSTPASTRNSSARGARTSVGGRSSLTGSSLSAGVTDRIPSEQERRQRLSDTPHRAMKNAMRAAAQEDSALVMGTFLSDDKAKGYTFGRERRFIPTVGRQSGSYCIATETVLAQEEARQHATRTGASFTQKSDTPGPGTYTPRYSVVAKPSPRASTLW